MYHEFVLDGETVKLKAEFKGYEGGFINPDDITLKVINSLGTELLNVPINDHYKVSAGTYCYDYLIENNYRGELIYEFSGMINGERIVIRDIIEVVGTIPNTTLPNLYGN